MVTIGFIISVARLYIEYSETGIKIGGGKLERNENDYISYRFLMAMDFLNFKSIQETAVR